MSIEYAQNISPVGFVADPISAAPPQPPQSRSLFRQAYYDTLASRSARLGLVWLFTLTFFAVFAPFIANSHPLLIKSGGIVSSPLLKYLTPADALLLLATAAAAVLFIWRRYSFLASLAIVVMIVVTATPFAALLIRPRENIDYAQYREAIAEGKAAWAVHAPIPYSPSDRLRDQPSARLTKPSRAHWAGTDTNGADVASLLIHASRVALSIGFISTSLAVALGILVGGLMGYYAGTLDLLGMRFIEIFEAVPRLFLLIAITAFVKERSIYLMMAVLGVTSWTGYARFLRAEFLRIRKLDYVQAAIAAGLPQEIILFKHMLANALTPILVSTTFGVAGAILSESVLSFLGLGLADGASWGSLLQQSRAGGTGFTWWIACFPGLAIFLTVFSYNLVGESIRDALDPKLRKRD